MKKKLKLYLFFSVILITFLNSCVAHIKPIPESGIWVCEEQNITLNFDNHTAILEYNGEMTTTELAIGYHGEIHLLITLSDDTIFVFRGDYHYSKGDDKFYVNPSTRSMKNGEEIDYNSRTEEFIFIEKR